MQHRGGEDEESSGNRGTCGMLGKPGVVNEPRAEGSEGALWQTLGIASLFILNAHALTPARPPTLGGQWDSLALPSEISPADKDHEDGH